MNSKSLIKIVLPIILIGLILFSSTVIVSSQYTNNSIMITPGNNIFVAQGAIFSNSVFYDSNQNEWLEIENSKNITMAKFGTDGLIYTNSGVFNTRGELLDIATNTTYYGNHELIVDSNSNLLYLWANGDIDSKNNLHVVSEGIYEMRNHTGVIRTYSINISARVIVDVNDNVHIIGSPNLWTHNLQYVYYKINSLGDIVVENKILSLHNIPTLEHTMHPSPSVSGYHFDVDQEGNIYLLYDNMIEDGQELRYGKYNPQGNITFIRDSPIATYQASDMTTSLALDSEYNIHVIWSDQTQSDWYLNYAILNSTGEIIEGPVDLSEITQEKNQNTFFIIFILIIAIILVLLIVRKKLE